MSERYAFAAVARVKGLTNRRYNCKVEISGVDAKRTNIWFSYYDYIAHGRWFWWWDIDIVCLCVSGVYL